MKDAVLQFLRDHTLHHATRSAIRSALGVTRDNEADYWTAEQELVDAKLIEIRRGRAGGVFLIESEPPTAGGNIPATDGAGADTQLENAPPAPPHPEAGGGENLTDETGDAEALQQVIEERRAERDHYGEILTVLTGPWANDEKFQRVFGAITAGQGRRATGGRWTRPDITLLCISKRIFDARPQGDVRTVEVKLFRALDVTAVFEALSHRSRSHYAYVLIVETPEQPSEEDKARIDAVIAEAARHGIGVLTSSSTADYEKWHLELDARRSDADPVAIEDFVLGQVSKQVRDEFQTTLMRIDGGTY